MKIEYLLITFLLLSGCMTAKNPDNMAANAPIPGRPERGYMHWLEKQAMYNQATAILAEVSQSERMWLNPSSADRSDILLNAAPDWLEVNADDFSGGLFASLAPQMGMLPTLGINGLYLGEINETAELWQKNSKAAMSSLEFAPTAGDAKAFEQLARSAESAKVELGSDLLSAATGMGSDFILQTRNAPGSRGIYAMLEAPPEFWPKLPAATKEMEAMPITENKLQPLMDAGLIPASLGRDKQEWSESGGWAATGEIAGIDGKSRRWLYRYSKNPQSPVLMWQDPFGQARRILSAAIIQKTGLQGQTLTGLHLEALMGLEPGSPEKDNENNASPGLEALNDLASQIHRYGGWAMQADALPPELIIKVLHGPCDFCRDDATMVAAILGLLSAKAAPLADIYENWLQKQVDFSRLARGLHENDGIAIRLARSLPQGEKIMPEVKKNAENQPLAQLLAKSEAPAHKANKFLLNLKIGLPGLAFYNSQELNIKLAGMIAENLEPDDFPLQKILQERQELKLAEGKIIKIYKSGQACLGTLTELPDGGYWLLAMNFGETDALLTGNLPKSMNQCRILANSAKKCDISKRKFKVALDGYECLNVIFL